MTPPPRTMSAARRISRSWGLTGCNSKYWLNGVGHQRSPGGIWAIIRGLFVAPGHLSLHAIRARAPATGGVSGGLLSVWDVRRDGRAHGGDGRAPARGSRAA